MTTLMIAIRYRNPPETLVPIKLGVVMQGRRVRFDRPNDCLDADCESSSASPNTTDEWPREKKNPTLSGRWPSFISLRVVLSIAAMWSASNAWRSPSV